MSSKGKAPARHNKSLSEGEQFQRGTSYIMELITVVYVFALLCIYPLYMENKYLNMGAAKYHFFKYVSYVFIGVLLLFSAIRFIGWLFDVIFSNQSAVDERNRIKPLDVIVDSFKKLSVTDISVILYAFISFISYALAEDKIMALNGFSGWYMGLISQCIFVLIYLFVSRYWIWSPTVMGFAIAVGALIYLIAVLQRFDIDIFNLYNNLQEDGSYARLMDKDIEKFVSTLGQTTWYSSYAVLILPFGMYWYFKDDQVWSRILTAVFVILGAASLCTVNSDSAYIAVVLILMVFFWFAISDAILFKRFLELVLMFLATFRFVGILQTLFPERMVKLMAGPEQVTDFVNHSTPMLVLLVAAIVFYIFYLECLRRSYDSKRGIYTLKLDKFLFLRKVMIWGALVVIWLVILFVILTTRHKLPSFMESLYDASFFTFDLDWGNHRGFNWRMAFTALENASIKDLIVGVGPDCFAVAMNNYCQAEVASYWNGLTLACAHNELLNLLVTEGILGTIAYLLIFITSIVRLGLTAKNEPMTIPCIAAIVAYLGHNIFCYQTCLCTPFIFMIMGIGEMIIRHTKLQAVKGI